MSHIPDDKLFSYSDRLNGKVVIITGAANGIGKEAATRFGSFGAKVVIGDLDVAGAQKTVQTIKENGGDAVSIKCNVTIWEDQVALFELAQSRYGTVDIVVPNAGVSELGSFDTVKFSGGKPVKPDLRTLDINLIGTLYSAHLALHYVPLKRSPGDLKAIVLIGSMASWQGIPGGAMYSASKHAVLGLMRSLYPLLTRRDIRISCIHPFFADTAIVPTAIKLVLAGIPLATVPKIAGAIIYSATNPDPETNGCAWLLLDNGPVFMVPREEFKMGVYEMIDKRVNAVLEGVNGAVYFARLGTDLFRILGKPLITTAVIGAAAKWSWDNQDLIMKQIQSLTGR